MVANETLYDTTVWTQGIRVIGELLTDGDQWKAEKKRTNWTD